MLPPVGEPSDVRWKDNWGVEPFRPLRHTESAGIEELIDRMVAQGALRAELRRLEREELEFGRLHGEKPFPPGPVFARTRQLLCELCGLLDLQVQQIPQLGSVLAKNASIQLDFARAEHPGWTRADIEAAIKKREQVFAEEVRAILSEIQRQQFDDWLADDVALDRGK